MNPQNSELQIFSPPEHFREELQSNPGHIDLVNEIGPPSINPEEEHKKFNYTPSSKKWSSYENAHLEMPLFRWCCTSFYRFRYFATTFFRFSLFRIFNIEVTVGGIIFLSLIVGLLAMYEYFAYTKLNEFGVAEKGKNTGIAASVGVAILFSISGRNSVYGYLMGVSYERIVIWHKILTSVVLGMIIFHAISIWQYEGFSEKNKDVRIGFSLLGLFAFMGFYSSILLWFSVYKLFWVLHRIVVIAIIVMLILHGAGIAFIGIGLWVFDFVFRTIWIFVNKSKVKTATCLSISNKVVEIRFPKNKFTYAAGQFVFITIPKISFWEPHPFSISSAPFQKDVTLHIKNLGDWTAQLHAMCKEKQELELYMDGPYGNPSINLEMDDKKLFLLIAGGIGVTPIISTANDLIDQYIRGRDIKKIFFVWSVRDTLMVPGIMNEQNLIGKYHSELQFIQQQTGKELSKDVLEIRIHQTKKNLEDANSNNVVVNSSETTRPFVYYGKYFIPQRMNLHDIFLQMKEQQRDLKLDDVCVLACGPKEMLDEVSSLSKKNSFSHHLEVFNF